MPTEAFYPGRDAMPMPPVPHTPLIVGVTSHRNLVPAELDGLRVRLSEFAGGMGELSMSGRAIKVEGFRHAALVDWVIHAGGGALPQADMIDRALED